MAITVDGKTWRKKRKKRPGIRATLPWGESGTVNIDLPAGSLSGPRTEATTRALEATRLAGWDARQRTTRPVDEPEHLQTYRDQIAAEDYYKHKFRGTRYGATKDEIRAKAARIREERETRLAAQEPVSSMGEPVTFTGEVSPDYVAPAEDTAPSRARAREYRRRQFAERVAADATGTAAEALEQFRANRGRGPLRRRQMREHLITPIIDSLTPDTLPGMSPSQENSLEQIKKSTALSPEQKLEAILQVAREVSPQQREIERKERAEETAATTKREREWWDTQEKRLRSDVLAAEDTLGSARDKQTAYLAGPDPTDRGIAAHKEMVARAERQYDEADAAHKAFLANESGAAEGGAATEAPAGKGEVAYEKRDAHVVARDAFQAKKAGAGTPTAPLSAARVVVQIRKMKPDDVREYVRNLDDNKYTEVEKDRIVAEANKRLSMGAD